MAALMICVWTFRAAETALFFLLCSINLNFAIDLFWAIVYSPIGIARFMAHGTPSLAATELGIFGGMVSVLNLWSFVYCDLEYSASIKRLTEKFWHFSPVEARRVGWRWKLPYPFVLAVCIWDVWFGLATAKFFRLNKWIVLVLCLVVTGTKCLTSGGVLVWIRHLDPALGKNVHLLTFILFCILITMSVTGIIRKKIQVWRRKPHALDPVV